MKVRLAVAVSAAALTLGLAGAANAKPHVTPKHKHPVIWKIWNDHRVSPDHATRVPMGRRWS